MKAVIAIAIAAALLSGCNSLKDRDSASQAGPAPGSLCEADRIVEHFVEVDTFLELARGAFEELAGVRVDSYRFSKTAVWYKSNDLALVTGTFDRATEIAGSISVRVRDIEERDESGLLMCRAVVSVEETYVPIEYGIEYYRPVWQPTIVDWDTFRAKMNELGRKYAVD